MKIILDETAGRLYRSLDPLRDWGPLHLILGTQQTIEIQIVALDGETATRPDYSDPSIETLRLDIGHAKGDPPLAGNSLGPQKGTGTEADPYRFSGKISLDDPDLVNALAGKTSATLRLEISLQYDPVVGMEPNPWRHLAQVPITILNTVKPF